MNGESRATARRDRPLVDAPVVVGAGNVGVLIPILLVGSAVVIMLSAPVDQ